MLDLEDIKHQLAIVPEGVTAVGSMTWTRLGHENGVLHTGGADGIVHSACKMAVVDYCPPHWDQTWTLLCVAPAYLAAMIPEVERLRAENQALRDVFVKRVATGAEVFGTMEPGETIPDFLKRLEEPEDDGCDGPLDTSAQALDPA